MNKAQENQFGGEYAVRIDSIFKKFRENEEVLKGVRTMGKECDLTVSMNAEQALDLLEFQVQDDAETAPELLTAIQTLRTCLTERAELIEACHLAELVAASLMDELASTKVADRGLVNSALFKIERLNGRFRKEIREETGFTR